MSVAEYLKSKWAVFTADGSLLHHAQLTGTLPGEKVKILCVTQTPSGYVVCDYGNRKAFFTDKHGAVRHTSRECYDPRNAVHTTWGHVLIADHTGDIIRIFGPEGELLGNLNDVDESIIRPRYLHLDGAEQFLYVGTGFCDAKEVRTYKFTGSNLPPLPVKTTERKLRMSVKLVTKFIDR